MKNCKQITMLVSESQDRDLSHLENMGLNFHFLFCSSCRRYAESIELLRIMMQTYETVAKLPDDVNTP